MLFLGVPFNSMLLITFCMMFLIKMHLHTSQNSITMPTFITSPFKIKSNRTISIHQYTTLGNISQIGDRFIAFYSPKWLVHYMN